MVHENNNIQSHLHYFLRSRSTNIFTPLHLHSYRYLTIFTRKYGNRIIIMQKARTSESRQMVTFQRFAFFSGSFNSDGTVVRRSRQFTKRVSPRLPLSSSAASSAAETREQREPVLPGARQTGKKFINNEPTKATARGELSHAACLKNRCFSRWGVIVVDVWPLNLYSVLGGEGRRRPR